jgi:hypothetical protein
MQSVLLGVAALACPVTMGVMMWMMGRRKDTGVTDGPDRGQQAQPDSQPPAWPSS